MSDNIAFGFDPLPSSAPDAPAEPYETPQTALGYLRTIVLLGLIFLPWVAIAYLGRLAFDHG